MVEAEEEQPETKPSFQPDQSFVKVQIPNMPSEYTEGLEQAASAKADRVPPRSIENLMNDLKHQQAVGAGASGYAPSCNFQDPSRSKWQMAEPPSETCSDPTPNAPQAGSSSGSGRRRFVVGTNGVETEATDAEAQGDGANSDGAVSSKAKPSMSWSTWAETMYSWTWKPLIRPPREQYAIKDMGRPQFVFRGRAFQRTDSEIENSLGQRLACSHFQRVMKSNKVCPQHCVVYLHGSSSSRLEAFDVLPVLLPAGLSVFCLDLSGSGQSDGDYISLGYNESQDLGAALTRLRHDENVLSIGIWGRSMGATAAVMRAAEDHGIAACVLDSPFTDLKMTIAEYIQNSQVSLPSFAIDAVIQLARSSVKSKAGFDIYDVAAIKYAHLATCPALFAVAADDSFVLPHHTQELHNKWGGDRQLRFFEGGHNGRRPKWFLDEAASYLVDKLESWAQRQKSSQEAEQLRLEAEEARRRTYWL